MKKLIFLIGFTLLYIAGISQQLNLDNQPLIWLKADFGVDTSQWADQSGNGIHAQWKQSLNIIQQDFNYHPAIEITALNGPLEVPIILKKKASIKVYTVYQIWDTAYENGIWNIVFDTNTRVGLTSHRMVNTKKSIEYSGTTLPLPFINALSQSWRNEKIDTSLAKLYVGGTDSLSFNGKLAEVLYFDKRPSKTDNEKVHTYLAIKYGITLDIINYITSGDTIIWSTKNEKEYNHDVAGIVRDDQLQLNQKQSSGNGGNSELIIHLGSLSEMNDSNQFNLPNNNYLIWGHNNKDLDKIEMDTATQLPNNNLIDRKWKINVKGNQIRNINTSLIIDGSKIDTSNINIELIICNNADTVFLFDSSSVYFPDSVDAQKRYYFNNIKWDMDNSGSDLFTFRIAPSVLRTSKHPEEDLLSENQTSKPFDISIYPNPSTGLFTIEVEPGEHVHYRMEISDVNGRILEQEEMTIEQLTKIYKTLKTTGVYFIKFSNKDESKTVKVIVQ